jgi:carbonic anhydrase
LSTLSPPKDFSPLASLVPFPESNFSPGMEHVTNISDPEMNEIFQRNRDWAEKQKARDPEFFSRLSSGQRPKYMFVGCADSRIPAETIMGMQPGDLFVHRNVANLAVNGDINFLSVLHFAVEHLQVGHIIVCGHYGCTGVYHAMHPTDTGGILENWLRNIRDVQRLHHAELEAIQDVIARFKRVVELNVIEQCVYIFKFGILQRKRNASMALLGKNIPQIHALVYDISTGLLHELPLRAYFRHYATMYKSIYELV